jgi:hypothetical protein
MAGGSAYDQDRHHRRRVRGNQGHAPARLPLGPEPEPDTKGERYVWLEEGWVNKLSALRGPGEDHSDVILWLTEAEG